ncbi:MAG: PaaI family thioesterase [Candidatus Doudnabacteria bacterium]
MEDIKRFFKNDRFAAYNGIEILEFSKGHARAKMEITDNHKNGLGIVHGGAVFTLADLAFAVASNSHGTVAVSINANISNMTAASSGTLYADAREISINPKLGTYTVDVTNEKGEIIAIFQGMVYRKKDRIDQLDIKG